MIPECKSFIQPISEVNLKSIEKPLKVPNPMGIECVKFNLIYGKYTTYEDLFTDVQCIWDNAKLFNGSNTEVFKLAEKMEKMSMTLISTYQSENNLSGVFKSTIT